MMDEQRLRNKLQFRLEALRRKHGITEEYPTPASISEAMFDSSVYPYPNSAFQILAGLLWSIDHQVDADGYPTNELSVALTVLDFEKVRNPSFYEELAKEEGPAAAEYERKEDEHSRAFWADELESWPAEDRRLVFEWTELAMTWPALFECQRDDLRAINGFWAKAAAG